MELATAVEEAAPEFGYFEFSDADLATECAPGDLDDIARGGALRMAAEALYRDAEDNAMSAEDRAVAEAALRRLYGYLTGKRAVKTPNDPPREHPPLYRSGGKSAASLMGLNVLTAPNEHGKSTVFDALHAVFFKPRKSWDKEIRSLAPHAGGEPSVAAEIELADGIYRIEKRWSSRRNGEARIQTAGRLIKQADDAEAWIADTLKAPKDGGPAGLLWVRQGLTGLDDGDASRLARRDLLTSVAGEVEAMTGGRRMDAARDRCRGELKRYLTATGRAKADGPLKRREDEVASLHATRQELATKSEKLRQELDRRRKLRRELRKPREPRGNRMDVSNA